MCNGKDVMTGLSGQGSSQAYSYRDHFAGASRFYPGDRQKIVLFIQGGGLKKAQERELARLEEEKLHLREEQRSLARIARLDGDSSVGATVVVDLDPLFRFLAKFWQDPSATR
jgi:hypothetical protein